eukprot:maker-scaffold121_size336169-snap-gene-0.12 protein:Tk01631 transcript:maker-scaffold121_size336169-snap-gene-0.12-mRNA-1 annotation:"inorganic pyrophosphatase"
MEEEIKDPWCDPENPRVVQFEQISAAAYRVRDGIVRTPCDVTLLKKSMPKRSLKLVMAGGYDNRMSENIDHLKELELLAQTEGVSVEFLKSPSDQEKLQWLRTSDCLLYTPSGEHFGIVPIEAMFCQLPVIAVNNGGPKETVVHNETGILCEATPEAFSEAMTEFVVGGKQLKTKMGNSGRKRVMESFSFGAFAGKLERIVVECLSGSVSRVRFVFSSTSGLEPGSATRSSAPSVGASPWAGPAQLLQQLEGQLCQLPPARACGGQMAWLLTRRVPLGSSSVVHLRRPRPCLRHLRIRSSPLASLPLAPLSAFCAMSSTTVSAVMTAYVTEQRGALNGTDYLLYMKKVEDNTPISPMHDIPLYHDEAKKIFNMVVEVPRWSNAKMEINLKEKLNPIKQDVKKGKLRMVANCFPHKGYIWNYGAIPQTWEDPEHVDAATKCQGDGDPIDCCEIGQKVHKSGDVIQVKILGTVALIDEGETDWKVLVIDITDPLADKLNDVEDIEKHMPGFLAATVEWFKIYKIPDGKPPNEFAFNAEPKNREFALKIIDECNDQWKKLMARDSNPEGLDRACTQFEGPSKMGVAEAKAVVESAAAVSIELPVDSAVDKWHYVKL